MEKAFTEYRKQGYVPGRIGMECRGMYKIYTESGMVMGQLSGKLHYTEGYEGAHPAAGDWAALREMSLEKRAVIHAILPRKSSVVRKSAGVVTREQVVAANVDTVFIVMSLNQNFNIRRLERYLVMVWDSNASPVIVLSKADLCSDIKEKVAEVEKIALGVPVYTISSIRGEGIDELKKYMQEGMSVAFVGSSGVGKSTLINCILGKDEFRTQEVSSIGDKGRHTTTARELVLLPDGGVLIDTPGMRELQLWDGDDTLSDVFNDIEELAERCRFKDCSHNNEPGCAVLEAVRNGSLERQRLDSYRKLQKELRFMEQKKKNLERIRNKRPKGKDHKKSADYMDI